MTTDGRQQRPLGGIEGGRQLLAALGRKVEPVPISSTYRLGTTVVAVAMVLLPLVYLAVLVGLVVGVVQSFSVLRSDIEADPVRFALSLMPALIAALLFIALVKPLFAPPMPQVRPLRLERRREPLLFAFVDRLCVVLGAPKPVVIQLDSEVNASASLAEKKGTKTKTSDDGVVLTLGAPLVAGLTLAEVAGVLAHEIGHFNQRSALRSMRFIRRIDLLFLRLAYERDAFDAWLERQTERSSLVVGLVLYAARGLIWLARRLFVLLVRLSRALSCFQLRQMEYDADRYETRLVGAEVFATTMEGVQLLSLAHEQAYKNLEELWADGRLPDNLPQLIVRNRKAFDDKLVEAVREAIRDEKVGLFSTHPADKDRLQSARAERSAPIFQSDQPAAALFRDFPTLERLVTRAHYCTVLGEAVRPETLIPVDETAARLDQSSSERDAFRRYFRGDCSTLWPLSVGRITPDGNVAGLQTMRERAFQSVERLNQGIDDYSNSWSVLLRTAQAEALLDVGLPVDAKDLELPGGKQAEVMAFQGKAQRRMAELEKALQPLERARGGRLAYALGLLATPETAQAVDPDSALRNEVGPLLEIQVLLGALFKDCRELMRDQAMLMALAKQWNDNKENQRLRTRLRQLIQRLQKRLAALGRTLGDVVYPFEHRFEDMTLRDYIVVVPEDEASIGDTFQAAGSTLDDFYEVYFRVAGRLAFIGERVEEAVGFEPLPVPDDE